jgi:hypothetical protein
MVQTVGSHRSHPSVRDGIGSGRPERCANLPYSETPHATIEVRAVAAVAIVNQESRRRLIPGAAFHDLLRGPVRCRMPRHGNAEDLPVREPDDEEDVKRLEQDGRDTEKVASPHVRCMPRQELSPCRAPAATPAHIFGHGPGGNLKPQPRQFGLDALLTPKAILGSHACDQSLKLYRDWWAATSFFMRRSPSEAADAAAAAQPTAAADKGFPRLAAPSARKIAAMAKTSNRNTCAPPPPSFQQERRAGDLSML